MRLPCILIIVIVALAAADSAVGQNLSGDHAVLVGRVVDASTHSPLVDAHVFIASSTIGTVTDGAGRFRLPRVPIGANTVYVSMVGYAPARIDSLFRRNVTYTVTFSLEPVVVEGPEIMVTGERDPKWRRSLRKFERLFIGESPNAAECTIENPEVLSFDTRWWGKITARASEPLVITNRALGYRITYYLEEFEAAGGTIRFDGEPLFEPLQPPDSATARKWRDGRRKAFAGSFRHFMLSLLRDTYLEEGFRVYRRYSLEGSGAGNGMFGFRPERVLEHVARADVHKLDFGGYIEVYYDPEPVEDAYMRWRFGSVRHARREQQSLLKLTGGPAHVDERGEVLEPYGVTVYGHFAYERVADLVPTEYELWHDEICTIDGARSTRLQTEPCPPARDRTGQ